MSEQVIPLFLDLAVALIALSSVDLAALPLTMPQFKVLALLLRGDTPTVSEVAHWLQVTPPTASGILDRLEEKRLIVRVDDPADRRIVHVHLAEDRKTLLRRLFPGAEEGLHAEFDALAPSEVERLRDALREVLGALHVASGEQVAGPSPAVSESRR